jgi:hypothetical protein
MVIFNSGARIKSCNHSGGSSSFPVNDMAQLTKHPTSSRRPGRLERAIFTQASRPCDPRGVPVPVLDHVERRQMTGAGRHA